MKQRLETIAIDSNNRAYNNDDDVLLFGTNE